MPGTCAPATAHELSLTKNKFQMQGGLAACKGPKGLQVFKVGDLWRTLALQFQVSALLASASALVSPAQVVPSRSQSSHLAKR